MRADEVAKELAGILDEFSASRELAPKLIEPLWEEGFYCLLVPKEFGGEGAGLLELALVLEEFSAHCFVLALSILIQALGILLLQKDTDAERKSKRLKRIVDERRLLAFALSEDWQESKTTCAEKTEQGYVINGRKVYVNQAREADWIIVLCEVEGGLSLFLLEKGRSGLFLGKDFQRSSAYELSWSEVILQNVEAKDEDLIGEDAGAEELCELALAQAGAGASAMAIGILNEALREIKSGFQREKFGMMEYELAELSIGLESARALTYQSAYGIDKNFIGYEKKAIASKIFSSELAVKYLLRFTELAGAGGADLNDKLTRLFNQSLIVRSLLGANSFLLENFI